MSPNQSPFDVHEVHEVAILVTASSLGCSSSIVTGSPTLLIPEPSPHDTPSSLGSSHGTPTVKFAPLPHIDPNRKRSLAPLGVPGRSRRMQVIQQEGGSLLWSTDPDAPEESMEDPIILFAKFIKKTSKMLWRRLRKGSKAVSEADVARPVVPVLDIRSGSDVGAGDRRVSEDTRGRRASWSPVAECRTLGLGRVQRRSTGDLPVR